MVEPLSALGIDLDRVWQAWLLWRRMLVAPRVAAVLALPGATREQIKDDALWEYDQAQALTAPEFSRASEHLAWQPTFELDECLQRTIEYFRDHLAELTR